MSFEDVLKKILNGNPGVIQKAHEYGVTLDEVTHVWTTTNGTKTYGGKYPLSSTQINISGTSCPWSDMAHGESIIKLPIDEEADAKEIVHIIKNDKVYDITREELYRLKFMLDDVGKTIESCSLEMFLNYLTAVKI